MSKRTKEPEPTKSGSESSEEEEVKPKKRKKQEKSSKASSSKKDEDLGVFEISDRRKVSVREFKGKTYIDIREYYEKDGEVKPGKKGIALKPEEWEKLKNLAGDIDEAIEELSG